MVSSMIIIRYGRLCGIIQAWSTSPAGSPKRGGPPVLRRPNSPRNWGSQRTPFRHGRQARSRPGRSACTPLPTRRDKRADRPPTERFSGPLSAFCTPGGCHGAERTPPRVPGATGAPQRRRLIEGQNRERPRDLPGAPVPCPSPVRQSTHSAVSWPSASRASTNRLPGAPYSTSHSPSPMENSASALSMLAKDSAMV